MKVTLVGTGCGSMYTMTAGAVKAIKEAGLVIGAGRLLDTIPREWEGDRIAAISSDEIAARIDEYKVAHADEDENENVCVIFSGDTGFYSGARPLIPLLEERRIKYEIVPGISSVQMLSARMGSPWQDWKLVSAHGLDCDAGSEVSEKRPTFFLTGGKLGPAQLCAQLVEAGKGDMKVVIAQRLSYDDEEISSGEAHQFTGADFDSLSVMLVCPEDRPKNDTEDGAGTDPKGPVNFRPGLPDYLFIRGDVPMTKREVRAVIAGHMQIMDEDVIWDVGAGTGSVTVEMAIQASKGTVYAVEMDQDGIELIRENADRFGLDNIDVIYGRAPQALEGLPSPDRIFIGGSDGDMEPIIDTALEKNPLTFICVTAILLETATEAMRIMESRGMKTEIAQVAISTGRGSSGRHMMIANNPIFVITGSMR